MKKLIAVILLSVVLFVLLLTQLALWNSRGNLLAFLGGQRDPGPPLTDRAVSENGVSGQTPYSVTVAIDLTRPVGHTSDKYLSFALDTSQVVGGKWWNPIASGAEMGSGSVHAPIFNFNRERLDTLVKALAPAYLRIGGSEADKVFYDLTSPAGITPTIPAGYQSVLTRQEWDAVNAFAERNGLDLIFTLNAGPASRDASGRWTSSNAEELLKYTAQQKYPVALWELGNELNLYWFVHGLSKRVSVDQYQQDVEQARALVKQYFPDSQFAGQGSAYWPVFGEPLNLFFGFMPGYLQRSGAQTDVVSWHYYPQQGRRGPLASRRAYPGRLLDPNNLDEAAYWAQQIAALRDRYAPGKPIWLGETGNAQFGGEPGLSNVYLAGLWWLDQLGLLAKNQNEVVVRQTLSGSDYGMIDDTSLEPYPDYWNSLLWKHLMGIEVYSATTSGDNANKLRVYAHATPNAEGSITLLVINLDPQRAAQVSLPQLAGKPFEVYNLNASDIFGQELKLNGQALQMIDDKTLPEISGEPHAAEDHPVITINPLSYTFIVVPAR